jgi:hypothetical protein
MEQFITTLVFVIPGLMAYYWLQNLGLSPSQKHNHFEMLAISTMLWVPTIILFIVFHNLLSATDIFYIHKLISLKSLNEEINSFLFIVYFIIVNTFFSFLISLLFVYSKKKINAFINLTRRKILKLADFSDNTTIWEEVFNVYGAKVVEVQKLDKPESILIGCLEMSSRALETDRSICLNDVDYFTKLVGKYKPAVSRVLVDTKAGFLIKIFDMKEINRIQENEDFSIFISSE